jgi:hypothetical protein
MGTSSNTREESEEVDAAAAMHDDAGDEGSEGAAMYEEEDETGPNMNESSSNRRLQQSPSSHQLEIIAQNSIETSVDHTFLSISPRHDFFFRVPLGVAVAGGRYTTQRASGECHHR